MSKKNKVDFEKDIFDDYFLGFDEFDELDELDEPYELDMELLDFMFTEPPELKLAIDLYVYSNGYISVDDLKKLLKKSKVKYNNEDFNCYTGYYYEYDNLLFYDSLVLQLYKSNKLKNNGKYKVFNKLEIQKLFFILDYYAPYILVDEFCKSCHKNSDNFYCKVEEELINVFDAILNGENAKEELEKVISKFKVPKNKRYNIYFLFDIFKNIFPLREKGGMSICEINGDYEERESYLKGVMFQVGPNKSDTEYLVIMYIKINGVIELSVLQEILEKHHDIHLSIKEIKKIIDDNECGEWLSYNNKYANCFFNNKSIINVVLNSKEGRSEYYIIKEPGLLHDEYISLAEDSIELFNKYQLNEKTNVILLTFIGADILEEDFNSLIIGNLNVLNEKDMSELYNKFSKILYKARKWCYNGFKEEEIRNKEILF